MYGTYTGLYHSAKVFKNSFLWVNMSALPTDSSKKWKFLASPTYAWWTTSFAGIPLVRIARTWWLCVVVLMKNTCTWMIRPMVCCVRSVVKIISKKVIGIHYHIVMLCCRGVLHNLLSLWFVSHSRIGEGFDYYGATCQICRDAFLKNHKSWFPSGAYAQVYAPGSGCIYITTLHA